MQSTKLGQRSGVFVDIIDSTSDKLIAEFFSIGSAATFILDVAKNRLGRTLKKNYIHTLLGRESKGVMKELGFRSVCSFMCDYCGYKITGHPAFRDPERLNRNLCEHCHISIEQDLYEANT